MSTHLRSLSLFAVWLLALVGGVLYLGGEFWGLLIILAAGAGYLIRIGLIGSWDDARSQLVYFAQRMAIPVAGIAAAVVVGGIVMWFVGYDPFAAYAALFTGGFVRNWHIAVLNAAPLMFTGLSVAFAFRAGLFNIGAEGQYYVGAMVATYIGIKFGIPAVFLVPLVFVLAGAAASAWAFVPALLKVRTGAHEVITTMMLAHVARYLSAPFVRRMGGSPTESEHPYVTDAIQATAELPRFDTLMPGAYYRLHVGVLIAVAMALLVYYILFRTRTGFEIRAVGANPDAARAQGISLAKNTFIALLFAGFLAGLSGFNQVLGLDHKMFQNLSAGYGWDGISVALLASNHPIGVIFTALLWGALDAGGQYMQRQLQTPSSIVEILKGIILFLIVARYIYYYLGRKLRGIRFGKTREQPE
jgi:general nucleoside transport system permease protein